MEAKDLMIGDWVLDGHVYAQVTSITCDGIIETTHNAFSNIELVETIPLTPEILEKNEWRYDKSACTWVNDDIGIHLEDGFDGNGFWWKAGVNHITPINYVHELQHASRLCGIKKEIVL